MINHRKMLEYDEGKKLRVYRCTKGFRTVGIGCNLDADPHLGILGKRLKVGDPISQSECEALFDYDYLKVVNGIKQKMYFFGDLLPKYQVVIINMVFQMGINGVLKFKGTLQAMQNKNDAEVVRRMKNSLWYKQTPNRANRMIAIINGNIPKEYL
jgi:lysozyme